MMELRDNSYHPIRKSATIKPYKPIDSKKIMTKMSFLMSGGAYDAGVVEFKRGSRSPVARTTGTASFSWLDCFIKIAMP